MELRALDGPGLETVAGWLAAEENYRWLDFGGTQILSARALKIMTQRDTHVLRVFTPDEGEDPIGLVGLSDIARAFGTATLWYVLGNKAFAGRGYTTRAAARLLQIAFRDLALEAVYAWAVDGNLASVRVLERNGFRPIGRRRRCHPIDGKPRDRLLFDLLAGEHSDQDHA